MTNNPHHGVRPIGRFFLGLSFGIVLTGQAMFISGAGHGSYAPLAFVASLTILAPLIALAAGRP
jgi:Ni,Fe-hydrogenase I cytochrome b subunit